VVLTPGGLQGALDPLLGLPEVLARALVEVGWRLGLQNHGLGVDLWVEAEVERLSRFSWLPFLAEFAA